jgi:hypothetical protein
LQSSHFSAQLCRAHPDSATRYKHAAQHLSFAFFFVLLLL